MLAVVSRKLSSKTLVIRPTPTSNALESKRGWFSQKGIKDKERSKKEKSEEGDESDFPSHAPIPYKKNPLNLIGLTEVVNVGRHVKITPAGKVNSYSTTIIAGNCQGVGAIGYGKADSVASAASKAYRDAVKKLVPIYRYKDITLPYSMLVNYHGTRVHLAVGAEGGGNKGMMCLMTVAEAFGVWGLTMKVHRSRNRKNIVRAFAKAVAETTPPEYTARRIGKKLLDINKIWLPAKGDNFFENVHL